MKRTLNLVLASALLVVWGAGRAATVNDGTTTTGLQRFANANNFLGDVEITTLTVGPSGYLTAAQTAELAFPPMETTWYATDTAPTSGVYRVAADFQPAQVDSAHQGGVMGWISLSTSNGVVLKINPSGSGTLELSVVNFAAPLPEDNESLTNLYNLDGTAATADFNSALADLTAAYVSTNFVTVDLSFSVPSAADQVALTNIATAHITARALQSPGSTNPPVQLGQAIELLTSLPVPAPADHRFGYFAVWAAAQTSGDVIGNLDNLVAEGGIIRSVPPIVTLTNPAPNAVFGAPATLTLQADAHDPDGTIQRVDFYNDTTLLGSAALAPYTFVWTNVPAGNYSLTAVATDNIGLRTTSDPVAVAVVPPPSVAITSPTNGASFSASAFVDITADASPEVVSMDFFASTNFLGTVTGVAPFTFTWTNVSAGDYALTARATSDLGVTSTSAPVQIHVTAPSVVITSPTDGATFSAPATIPIATQVSSDVASVDFFAASTLLGTVTGPPFAFTWTNVPAGDYALTARATSDLGVMATSAPVQVHVTGGSVTPPTVIVTTTPNGFELAWGATGFQLQYRPGLSSGTWTNWPTDTTSLTRITVPFSAASQFFQLRGAGTPAGPELTIQLSGNVITVSWPASVTGYQLQATPTLTPPAWLGLPSAGNTYSGVPLTPSRFFRLAPQ